MLVTLEIDDVKISAHHSPTYNWLELVKWANNEIEYRARLYFTELATIDNMISKLQLLREKFPTDEVSKHA